MRRLLVALLCGMCLNTAQGSPSCLDEQGSPVDSWTVLKAAGSFSYYLQYGSSFVKSNFTLDQSTSGCVMQTAGQMYGIPSGGQSYALAVYNDEPPGLTVGSQYAHQKGMLMSDSTSGYWLVHSMPLWPNDFSHSGPGPFPTGDYAQSITCVTVSSATADVIAGSLMVSRPYIFASRFDADLSSTLPAFQAFANKQYTSTADPVLSPIKSLGGEAYLQFAKSAQWGQDLWDDLIAPYYQTPMAVETWRNGVGGRISSVCAMADGSSTKIFDYEVFMVAQVAMPDGTTWKGTKDHSKVGFFSLADVVFPPH